MYKTTFICSNLFFSFAANCQLWTIFGGFEGEKVGFYIKKDYFCKKK